MHHTERISGSDTTWLTQYIHQSDTAIYRDTLWQREEFRVEIYDTLCGNRIRGREVRWADLSPTRVMTITNTLTPKPPLVKVYLGIDAYGGSTLWGYNADLAPAASVLISDRYMIDAGYYMLHRELMLGAKVKLSFRR